MEFYCHAKLITSQVFYLHNLNIFGTALFCVKHALFIAALLSFFCYIILLICRCRICMLPQKISQKAFEKDQGCKES